MNFKRTLEYIKGKMNIRILAVLISVLCLVLSVSGIFVDFTGSNANKALKTTDLKISFAAWGSPSQREIMKKAAKEFSANRDIAIDVYCFSDLESCRSKVLTQFAAGDSFDVFYSDELTFDILSKKGWLLDLTAKEKDSSTLKEDYYPIAYNKGMYKNKLLGLPAGINPALIYYNPRLFRVAGIKSPEELYRALQWDLKRFTEICRKFGSKNIYGMAIKSDWQTVTSIIKSVGPDTVDYDIDGTIITSQAVTDTFNTIRELINEGGCLYMGSLPRGVTEDELFKSEKVAAVLAGYDFAALLADAQELEWDVVPFPSDGKGFNVTPLSIPVMSASSSTRNPLISADFIRYYTGSEGQRLRVESGERMISSLKSVNKESALKITISKHSNYFFDSLAVGFTEDIRTDYLKNSGALYSRFDEYWKNLTDISSVIRTH